MKRYTRDQETSAWHIFSMKKTYNSIIQNAASRGDIENAESWMNQMSQAGVMPDMFVYCTMINACAESENIAEAEHWLHAMEEDIGVKERMILHLGKEDAARKIADAQGVAYSTMMKALVKSGDFEIE